MLTVVTGAPCSGKTTYVRQHALTGDIIIDFDHLAQALGSAVDHGHSDDIAAVAAEARHAAIGEAIRQHQKGHRVWIVDTAPGEKRLRQYAIAGAKIARMDAEPAELHRRADAERPATWHNRIDQWLATSGKAVPGDDPQPRPATAW